MICYFNPKTGEISKSKNHKVPEEKMSIEEARQAWLDGEIEDCNLAFERLASYDFSIIKVLQFYDWSVMEENRSKENGS